MEYLNFIGINKDIFEHPHHNLV